MRGGLPGGSLSVIGILNVEMAGVEGKSLLVG